MSGLISGGFRGGHLDEPRLLNDPRPAGAAFHDADDPRRAAAGPGAELRAEARRLLAGQAQQQPA